MTKILTILRKNRDNEKDKRNQIKEMLGISDSTLKRRLKDGNWKVKELFVLANILDVDVLDLID